MKTVVVSAVLSVLIMGLTTVAVGSLAASSRLLVSTEIYVALAAMFLLGMVLLWGFLLWAAVACTILGGSEPNDPEGY